MAQQLFNEVDKGESQLSMDTTEHNIIIDSPENKRKKSQHSKNTADVASSSNNVPSFINQQNSSPNVTYAVIQFKFTSEEDNFSNISPIDIKDFLNTISASWDFISFSKDQKCMTFSEKDKNCLNILINIKQIKINQKSIDVELTKVTNLNKNKGIIFKKQILALSNEEIKNHLKDQNVSDIVRITKTNENGLTFDTGSFIIIFDGEVPNSIKIDFIQISVNKLKPKPMKCNHCQLIGHTMKWCLKINKEMCKICFQEIVLNIENHTCILKCKNCNLNHKSDDKNCPEFKNEIEILEIKSKLGISYSEAKEILIQEQKAHIQLLKKLNNTEEIRNKELQLLRDNHDSMLEKYLKIQSLYNEEKKEKINLKEIVIPELKEKIEILENEIVEIKADHHIKSRDSMIKNSEVLEKMIQDNTNYLAEVKQITDKHQLLIDEFRRYKESLGEGIEFIKEFIDSNPALRSEYNTFCEKKISAGCSVLEI